MFGRLLHHIENGLRRLDNSRAALKLRTRTLPFLARFEDRRFGLQFFGVAIAAVIALNYTLYATCGLRGCPDASRLVAYQPGGASILLDRNGKKFADLAPVEREMVKLAQLPDYVPAAFVSVEDKRFYKHEGVDWIRVAGAAVRNLLSGDIDAGSSTITMQLSRNVFSDRLKAGDKSLRRKIFEARVARTIEKKFSKEEILELYLNHIYFGGGAYGIQTAARYYYGKSANKLRLSEAAMIAALPKAPAHYDPREHPRRARERRNLVLARMAEQGFVTDAEAAAARERRLGVTSDPPGFRGTPPLGAYFVQLVRRELEEKLGEDVYTKQLRVHTTLDINAQTAAEQELARQLSAVESGAYGSVSGQRFRNYDGWTPEGPSYLQGAAVVMEVGTGDVLALVGGRDMRHSAFNRATLARRQSGSAFKPFVYAAALQEGYATTQPILDSPVRLVSNGRAWEPRNYDNDHYGTLSMRTALAYSRNIPAVRLAAAVGEQDVAAMARAAGIRAEVKQTPMIALGITEVTPLELTAAFGTFAGRGTHSEPRLIVAVEDEEGEVIYRRDVVSEPRIDPAVAFVLTDMLADAVNYGTGNAVREVGFDGPVAGKTGTTSDGADVWFVGYTPDLVAGVWIGYDERRPLPARANGGTVSAPVFGRIMRRIYRERDMPVGFLVPSNVVVRMVDPESGFVLEEGCYPIYTQPVREIFVEGAEPRGVCPRRGNQNVLDALADLFAGLFESDRQPQPEPGVTADGSRDVLGAERLARRSDEENGRGRRRGRDRDDDDDDDDNARRGRGNREWNFD